MITLLLALSSLCPPPEKEEQEQIHDHELVNRGDSLSVRTELEGRMFAEWKYISRIGKKCVRF